MSSIPKQKRHQKSNTNVGQKMGAGTGLNDWFIAIFAISFLFSLSLNCIHMFYGDQDDKYSNDDKKSSPMHQAMKDFTDGGPTSTSRIPLKERRKQQNDKMKPFIGMHNQRIKKNGNTNNANAAGLNCKDYGGPSFDAAQEMVYWHDIPSDSLYVSPLFDKRSTTTSGREYLTFEPDGGGWNNIRMAMESTIALSVAMGRTLVMPPQKRMYLLGNVKNAHEEQRHHFTFVDFFPISEMAEENQAFNVISMKEYLEEEAMQGKLVNQETGKVEFPPGNRTDWNGINNRDYDILRGYLRNVSNTLRWNPGRCLPAFPSSGNHQDVEFLQGLVQKLQQKKTTDDVNNNLFEVDNPDPIFRLGDILAGRKNLCVYDEKIQNEKVVHFQCNHKEHLRLLVHFYAFLFFEDWREELWMKRFIRDHLRYRNEIQCAAARIVDKIRQHVKKRTDGKLDEFDTFHVRRGDFQYRETRVDIHTIIDNTKAELTPGSTVFIATDEKNKTFFDPMKEIYDLLFLDDFKNELKEVNSNYYGMIDQLVSSRGRIFFGCWQSTFTGYINRIRGYHSIKDKTLGHENGELPNTFYYVTRSNKSVMHKYSKVDGSGFYSREYPTSWRGIDKGIAELAAITKRQNITSKR